MIYRTIRIAISDEEMQRLNELAAEEYRRPADQARYLLRSALGLTDRVQKETGAVRTLASEHGASLTPR